MDCEDQLVPEEAQGDGGEEEALCIEEVEEGGEEGQVVDTFDGIGTVRAFEQTSGADLLLKSSIFGADLVLSCRV